MGTEMTKRERRWCLIYAAILAILTSLPYLIGFTLQGEDWRFTGFVFGVEDGNSYIAKMLLGAQGEWLFRTPYSTSYQRGVVAFLPYLLLGKLAAGQGMHEQLTALLHLFRVLAIPLAVLATYQFTALFITSEPWKRWATVMATAGGGLGWILILLGRSSWLGSLPLDFYSPETFGFLANYGLPHLVLARALMLFGLTNYLQSHQAPKLGWLAGACFLLLALVQPLSTVSVLGVIFIHQAILFGLALFHRAWKPWKSWLQSAFRTVLVPLPLTAYLGLAFTRDPFLRAWTEQNKILSPHPMHYLIAYGLLLLPAVAGMRRLIGRDRVMALLPIGWVFALPVLAYVPHNLQRRLVDGLWVALVVLAVAGLSNWIVRPQRRWVGHLVLSLSLLSAIFLLIGGFSVVLDPSEPVFRKRAEVAGFLWLESVAEPGSIVLSSYETGNALPGWAPVRVVVGHGPETVGLDNLLPEVRAFYGIPRGEGEKSSFLKDMGVDYVWLGPHERDLGEWDPEGASFLVPLYQQDGYEIYEVSNTYE
jgi:hypothetical protein